METINSRTSLEKEAATEECPEMRKTGNGLLQAANQVVRIVGCVIFVFLSQYSLRYTHYMVPGGEEKTLIAKDSVAVNLLALGGFLLVYALLLAAERRLSPTGKMLVGRISTAAAVLCTVVLGVWWICSAERLPEGDQAFVYGGASYFIEGDFKFLAPPGAYFAMYPHQLPLTACMELLFRVVGPYNFFAYEVVCVVLAAASVFAGSLLLGELTDNMSALVMYSLAMIGCFPMIFYTSWVYGDIPSVFFALMAAWLLLRYDRTGRTGNLAGMVCAMTMALLVRKNSMILLIALCLVCGVYAVRKKDWKIVTAALLAVLVPWVVSVGIAGVYELRSGYERYGGIPTVTWVDMGMHESDGKYGWYDNSAKEMYYACECDIEATKEAALRHIREHLEAFRQDMFYTKTFYREKILSQWNNPLYQSLYFNSKYLEHSEETGHLAARLATGYFEKLLNFSNALQFVIYFGMVCYFAFAVTGKSNILQHMLGAGIIGGFLFSILWEAKARYIFPYYVFMFPLAMVGYVRLLKNIQAVLTGMKRGQKTRIENRKENRTKKQDRKSG